MTVRLRTVGFDKHWSRNGHPPHCFLEKRNFIPVSFGAPGQVWQVLQAERSLSCELPVRHVAERACVGVIRGTKPRKAKERAASIEPVSASLHKVKEASLPNVVKPATARVVTGICTWRAFRGERGRRVLIDLLGTWETRPGEPRLNGGRECITDCPARVGSRRGA
jgi:hypothetical protein